MFAWRMSQNKLSLRGNSLNRMKLSLCSIILVLVFSISACSNINGKESNASNTNNLLLALGIVSCCKSTTDLGAGSVFTNPIFVGRFKTSSLRSIELTAPYMHDGRFATLEEVVEHYNSGIKNHPTLAPALKDASNNPIKLNLTATQKSALVAFLKTLTDNSVSTEAKWSNPFR